MRSLPALLLPLLLAGGASALEADRARPAGPAAPGRPARTATCEVRHFDDCGAIYLLLPVENFGDTFGVAFDACAPDAELTGVWIWQLESVPPGWGYTGFVSVYEADEDDSPVEPPLARQPYVQGEAWTYWPFSVSVPERFVVTIEYHGGGIGGVSPVTDNPMSNACIGYRAEPHSYYYGTVDAPLRPGSPLFGEPYGAYELTWQADLAIPTGTPRTAWSAVKGLYR